MGGFKGTTSQWAVLGCRWLHASTSELLALSHLSNPQRCLSAGHRFQDVAL
jgi:hypothetical protein